jgi:hypothetical protein
MRCRCGKRECWRVSAYKCNHSAFSGYRRTPSDYSEVVCSVLMGGCGARWRTKAAYVEDIYSRQRTER